MVTVAPLPPSRRRAPQVWAALLLGFSVLLGSLDPASAQGWFGGFFGGGGGGDGYRQSSPPPYPGGGSVWGQRPDYGYSQDNSPAPRRRPPRRRVVVEPPKDAPVAVKKDATIFVDVFGDSLGQLLANGLDDALADRADVAVVHKAKGSTGLVTTDYYDWPKTIDDLLASKDAKDPKDKNSKDKDPKEKIDVAVMMVGSNDRQPIREDGKTLDAFSDEWREAYRKRITRIDEAFKKKGIPLIWVGIPITRDQTFADDMAALNDIYHDLATKTGALYVDTWEAFSDANGNFNAYGPDINGQTVKLRSSDGIHFTAAGARKLAHFVETHIRRALDGKTPPAELPTAEAPTDGKAAPAVAAVKPDAGPINNLNEAPAAKNGELAIVGSSAKDQAAKEQETLRTSLARGEAPPQIGRADDMRWPKSASPAPASAPASVAPDKTSGAKTP